MFILEYTRKSLTCLLFVGYTGDFEWGKYLVEVDSIPVPYHLFTRVSTCTCMRDFMVSKEINLFVEPLIKYITHILHMQIDVA